MHAFMKKGFALTAAFALAMSFAAPSEAQAASQSPYYWTPWTVPTTGYYYQYQPQQYQFQNQYQYLTYLMQLVAQLQEQLRQLQEDEQDDEDKDGDAEIRITTESATDVDDDSARLRGEIDFNSSDYAYVWFEWGEDRTDLDEVTPEIRLDDDGDEDFSVRIRGLEEDERYYFRAVGEDEDGERDYGTIKSFTTDDEGRGGRDEDPDVTTLDARDITDDSVELRGDVDMNDFRNGLVFFVWGEDEDQVEDVEDDYDTYGDIDEDGDDLQKQRVDSDLDGRASYQLDIRGLDNDTKYFYAICVEYEDEDDDETLICGATKSFRTDD